MIVTCLQSCDRFAADLGRFSSPTLSPRTAAITLSADKKQDGGIRYARNVRMGLPGSVDFCCRRMDGSTELLAWQTQVGMNMALALEYRRIPSFGEFFHPFFPLRNKT